MQAIGTNATLTINGSKVVGVHSFDYCSPLKLTASTVRLQTSMRSVRMSFRMFGESVFAKMAGSLRMRRNAWYRPPRRLRNLSKTESRQWREIAMDSLTSAELDEVAAHLKLQRKR